MEISAKTLEGELSTISASIAALDAKLADQSNKRKTFDESRADLALQVRMSPIQYTFLPIEFTVLLS